MIVSRNIENRVFWNPNKFESWPDYKFDAIKESANFMLTSRTRFVHDIMSSFENIPVSLPDTADILAGKYTENIAANDYLRIRAFASAINLLSAAVSKNLFEFNLPSLKLLHKKIARHELTFTDLGKIRNSNVRLGDLEYYPPVHVALNSIWTRGFSELMLLNNKLEQSIAAFLWLSRTQFFVNCNKRTATLAMAGIQAANLMPCIIFPESDKRSFAREITYFYESGNADRMIDLFKEYYNQAITYAKETSCLSQNTSSVMELTKKDVPGPAINSKNMDQRFPTA